jgi:hypothetical protein
MSESVALLTSGASVDTVAVLLMVWPATLERISNVTVFASWGVKVPGPHSHLNFPLLPMSVQAAHKRRWDKMKTCGQRLLMGHCENARRPMPKKLPSLPLINYMLCSGQVIIIIINILAHVGAAL